jgi:protein TonB
LFEATTGATQRGRRSPMATILSIALHGVAVLIVLALGQKTVDAVAPAEVDVTFFSAPPPPPPPPPPPASTTSETKKKKKKKPKVEKEPDPIPQELVQPTEIPEEIPEIEEPEDAEESDEVADAGVVGGVEGGVAGGVVGGVAGGVKGGVVGGSLNWNSDMNSAGRCRDIGMPRYPEMAKSMNITGMVKLKIAVDETGKVMKAKDDRCDMYQTADRQERRTSWHPRLCMRAVSGPEELYFDTLMHYAALKCAPWVDQGKPIPMVYNLNVNFKLN